MMGPEGLPFYKLKSTLGAGEKSSHRISDGSPDRPNVIVELRSPCDEVELGEYSRFWQEKLRDDGDNGFHVRP